MQELINQLKRYLNISTEAEEYILSNSSEKRVEKGEVLIREGQKVDKIYYVVDGCLRSYCTDKRGKEHTLLFATKKQWISDYMAIHKKEAAALAVESLTNSLVVGISVTGVNQLFDLFPEFEPWQRENLTRHAYHLQKRILNQLQLTAKERYESFLKYYSEIEKFTPNYHIASYLGITQESLSRIRAEGAKK
ncbi:MAG: Crp/Fnr family transcriptional regulator [Bacteroidales bacterium]|nr:Crp/Fnr family transcriptional regulator [Bacteroidales bacterium]